VRFVAFAVVGVVAALWAGSGVAHRDVGRACRPAIVTAPEVARALGRPTSQIELAPLPSGRVPQVAGQKPFAGRLYECDWGITTNGHIGLDDGRASLLVFADDAEAMRWFTAYTAKEVPPCTKKAFPTAACSEPIAFPGGINPLFQVVRGKYVVWIHVIQKRFHIGPLKALANDVFAHAPQAG
jgi:hypothetical protein